MTVPSSSAKAGKSVTVTTSGSLPAPAGSPSRQAPITVEHSPPRVLVVDDDQDERELVASFLRQGGFAVVTAECAKAAIHLATTGWVDAAVLDVVMPEPDGWEICRRLVDMFAPGRMPVVMMTALPAPDALPRSFEEGAVAHVCKPIRMSVLVSTLRQQLLG